MPDKLSILSHSKCVLAKTWLSGGDIKPYDSPKYFTLREARIANIRELSELLEALEHAPKSCLIRGRFVGEARAAELDPEHKGGQVLRRLGIFEDQPLHAVMIEVDRYEGGQNTVIKPLDAITSYISTKLPPEFHEISYHWQLSNSAGRPGSEGLLKAHLWFWLSHAATSDQLRAWADSINLDCDHSVMNPVQVHYTSAPIFEPGLTDPVPVRSGFVEGLLGDIVPLDLSSIETAARKLKDRGALTVTAARDGTAAWLYQHGLVLGVGGQGQLHIACPFEAGHSGARKGIDETSYFLQGTGGYEKGTFTCFHDTCRRNHPHEHFIETLGVYHDDFAPLPDDEVSKPLPRITRRKDGKIIASLPNLEVVFDYPEHFGVQVRFDTFLNNLMITPANRNEWKAIDDFDSVDLRTKLEKRFGFCPIGRDLMRDALLAGGYRHQFDSAQHWLGGLVWDGIPRIGQFFSDYFGAEGSAYCHAVSRYLWTALAGRVMEPGIKADMVPILVGRQGIRKSSGVKAISPSPDFFTEIDLNERDADQSRIMRGKLVGEIGELRGLHTRDAESIKTFIARTHEEWIPKYQERACVFPRRLVFIGTTNDNEFLSDSTGNRRWLPLAADGGDVEAISRDRDQLWAEAREVFMLTGIDWSAERLAAGAHDSHRYVDPWEYIIDEWMDIADPINGITPRSSNKLTIPRIARDALGIESKNFAGASSVRIGKILQIWGYCKKQTHEKNGKILRFWTK